MLIAIGCSINFRGIIMIGGMNSAQFANQLVSTERSSQDKLNQKSMSDYRATKSAYSTLDGNLDSVLDRLNDFNKNALKSKSSESSNKDVIGAKVHSNAPTGEYSVKVDKLASHFRTYKSFFSENAKVGAGNFELNFGGKTLLLTTDANTTVTQLRDRINQDVNNPGFTASLIRTGGSVKLMISADKAGATTNTADAQSQLDDLKQSLNVSTKSDANYNKLKGDATKLLNRIIDPKTKDASLVEKLDLQERAIKNVDAKNELTIFKALMAQKSDELITGLEKDKINLGDTQIVKVISEKNDKDIKSTKDQLIKQDEQFINDSYNKLQAAIAKDSSLSLPSGSKTDALKKSTIYGLINKTKDETVKTALRDLTKSNIESSISSLAQLKKLSDANLENISKLKSLHAISGQRTFDDSSAVISSLKFTSTSSAAVTDKSWTIEQGQNASLSINGIHVESSSNQLTNVIDGVDLDLNSTGSSTISVKDDIKASKKAVQKFVDNINDLLKNINDVTRSMGAKALDPKKNTKDDDDDDKKDKDKKDYKPKSISEKQIGILKGDSSIRGLEQKIRNIAFFQGPNGMRLTDFGISLSRDGTFSIDDKKLETSIKTKGNQLTEFLTSKNGISGQIKHNLEPFTKYDGFLDMKKKTMDSQIHTLENSMDSFNRLMKQRYNNYLTEFTTMEGIINEMNSVSGLFAPEQGDK